ncbi:MAG TPA: 30S ribosomal protein S2 [Myxococcota bacterium]|nr:30S ribosomal protein S2 [Myxococcota bacterium]
MAEATGDVSAPRPTAAPAAALLPSELSLRGLLEVGAHFGHQTRRWDPRMRPFIFGERNGIHILNLDATHGRLREALDFLRETVARGGKVLFVATKRQAQESVANEARRAGQFYVNNRWLGGMLTNFRTVKRSIERFKEELELLENEEKAAEVSKKERARIARSVSKYRKSLDGIREMSRLPDALFVIDVGAEHIALTEAQRLGIPIVAIVDSNCNPEGIDYVVPGNDDAIRAIQYYCKLVADACQEGAALFNERVQAEVSDEARAAGQTSLAPGGRRVVEIRQAPRRGRGASGGGHSGGTHSAEGRRRRPPAELESPASPAPPAPSGPTEPPEGGGAAGE